MADNRLSRVLGSVRNALSNRRQSSRGDSAIQPSGNQTFAPEPLDTRIFPLSPGDISQSIELAADNQSISTNRSMPADPAVANLGHGTGQTSNAHQILQDALARLANQPLHPSAAQNAATERLLEAAGQFINAHDAPTKPIELSDNLSRGTIPYAASVQGRPAELTGHERLELPAISATPHGIAELSASPLPGTTYSAPAELDSSGRSELPATAVTLHSVVELAANPSRNMVRRANIPRVAPAELDGSGSTVLPNARVTRQDSTRLPPDPALMPHPLRLTSKLSRSPAGDSRGAQTTGLSSAPASLQKAGPDMTSHSEVSAVQADKSPESRRNLDPRPNDRGQQTGAGIA
jgi:hypothetical protein